MRRYWIVEIRQGKVPVPWWTRYKLRITGMLGYLCTRCRNRMLRRWPQRVVIHRRGNLAQSGDCAWCGQ